MSEKIVKEWQDKSPTLEQLIINDRPIQLVNQDEVLREYTLGGPKSPRDVRFIVDIETLEILLKIATQSSTKRAIIPAAGITLKVRRAKSGHVYETLHLTGGMPVPEQAPTSITMDLPRDALLRDSVSRKWR